MRKPSKTSSIVSTPLYPSLLSGAGIVQAGLLRDLRLLLDHERSHPSVPRLGVRVGDGEQHDRARRAGAFVAHIFWPVIAYSSPSRTARVRIAWTSEPACGSVIEYAKRSSPVAIRGR